MSLFFGSLIRFINEGDKFKSPLDSHDSISSMFKNKEFWKTLFTGFLVYVGLLLLVHLIREH